MSTGDTSTRTDGGLRTNMKGLLSLALASCLAVTTEMLPVGLLPVMGRSFGVAESSIGLLVSLYAGLVALLAVPMTIWTRQLPRKPILVATLGGYVVSNLVVALSQSLEWLAFGRGIGGVAHALFFSLCIGYVPRLVGPANLGRGLAIAAGGATAGYVLGVPISTSMGNAIGWRSSFVVLAVLSAATVVAVTILLPAVPGDAGRREKSRGHGSLSVVVTSNALTFLGHYTVYTYISILLLSAGVVESALGPMLLIFGACGVLGLWLTGRTLDRSPRRTMLVVLGLVATSIVAVGSTHLWLLPLVVCVAVWSGAFGGVPSMYQSAAVRTEPTSPETAGAWINATANVGIAGGAGVGGIVLPWLGLGGLALTGAALVAAGLLVASFTRTTVSFSATSS
ncbi:MULTISPECIES: MFS transporter [Nocardiaceae]|jgi:predicted MFS family arabinose efflux permease|uniref:MFS transporter n=1 Tax=Nocardiaceae TaxID=85025 RepID=UPI00055DD9F3|nr:MULTISPECIES: MFS transporter [Rhodococcus]OZF00914.1 MFS transporter [Rhodococcus sp. 15-1189-1-1a]OZF14567.1 MFS transporter [Rhodococcus sp. 14-2686-1-2]